ncbi:carboxymuconolactone decarboxylase family protein [Devosia alba]|uniref:carboxymuconolactone decarboxylase family protein n=1 Tax=Devosia alba TaxID=3152360 RepID=UPI0032670C52
MPRIPILSPEQMNSEQRRIHDAVVSGPRGMLVGPLRAAIHRPELADKWQQFGELLRYRTSLPSRLSELAILVTARHWDCQVEWHLHERDAIKAGLEAPIMAAVQLGERPAEMDADTAAAHDFGAELLRDRFVSEPTYQLVLARWGVVGVIELTAIIGYYSMVAMTLNAHELPLPDGVAPPLEARA